MEDFTYEDIKNLITGLIIGKHCVENSTKTTDEYKQNQLENMNKAMESLDKLRKKIELKDDPYTWYYSYDRRKNLKRKL